MTEKEKKILKEKQAKLRRLKARLDYTTIFLFDWDEEEQKIVIKAQVFYYIVLTYKSTFNNIFAVISSSHRQPVYFLSSGMLKYKNSKKTTDLALRAITTKLFAKIKLLGYTAVHIYLKSYGKRMRLFFFELKDFLRQTRWCLLLWIEIVNFAPLNGCKRPRRVL